MAVLGHDLRNPVTAFGAGLRQLHKEPLTERAQEILPLMRSSLLRMNDLIDNILMHAKSRLGGGIRISATPDAPLEEAITQVVEEIRAAFPAREILLDVSFGRPVNCDAPRVAQAISNLLSNAVRHGAQSAPIEVRGLIGQGEIEISVTNKGEAVPAEMRQNLFQPFRRGAHAEGDGLGLGLYIASSIAMAHGGRIDLICEAGTTTFALTIPLSAG